MRQGADLAKQYKQALAQFEASTEPLREAIRQAQDEYRRLVLEILREEGIATADEDMVGVETDDAGNPTAVYRESVAEEVLSG
jgi:hypothetical protein